MDPSLIVSGHGLAAVAFLALAVFALVRARPRRLGAWLAFASLAEASWALAMALGFTIWRPSPGVMSLAETFRAAAWFALLIALPDAPGPGARQEQRGQLARARRAAALGAALVCLLPTLAEAIGANERVQLGARILLAIFGLLLLEQLWRNTSVSQRWAIKFLCIALLALFGFDLVMYSDALLFGRLDIVNWTARGFANALLALLVLVAVLRSRRWGRGITVSREVVFHTATLLGAGLYLVAVASLGWWSRLLGGGWGGLAQTLVIFVATIGFAAVLLSGKFRAWLRVTIAKHFLSHRYDYRREWLEFTERLSRAADGGDADLARRVIEELARLVECRTGALWLQSGIDGDYERIANWGGMDEFGAPVAADAPLADFLRRRDWVVSVPEWRGDPQRYGGLSLPHWSSDPERVWLIVPLSLHGELVGFVLLGSPHARIPLNWEVTDLLKTVGRQAASYLRLRQALGALVQARQFESFNRMSAFVVHDLKNLVAQLSLLLANATRHRDNPEFQADMLSTVENVMTRMQALLLQLRVGAKPIDAAVPLPVEEVLESAVRAKKGMRPEPSIEVDEAARGLLVRAHRDRLERVIGHLVQNATEATPDDGRILVRARRDGGGALIEVEDSGRGMSRAFIRERLFRPFESTKAHGMGIGTFESREYVRELGGRLEVESAEERGTIFRIWLPVAESPAAPAPTSSLAAA